MKNSKINFGLRMAALKWAKRKLAKEQKDIKEKYPPVSPLDQPVAASVSLKPIEATAQTPAVPLKIEVVPINALDRTIQRLREQAIKFQ